MANTAALVMATHPTVHLSIKLTQPVASMIAVIIKKAILTASVIATLLEVRRVP
jgi:hypothetical protein